MAENMNQVNKDAEYIKIHEGVTHKEIEILAALLVAFPQMSRVTFDPDKRGLSMAFLCQGPVSKRKRKRLETLYLDSIEVYARLTGRDMSIVRCYWETIDDFYCFHVERDVASLSTGELNLTVSLISGEVELISESEEPFATDSELAWSARLLVQELVERIRDLQCSRKLVALREGEKVIVFHR